ncbi:hypothetical protein [Crocinitomix catalasitica]|uniref:hypothetical protein n=1 Tax=Crocinitomix catalasitica TaxID=184607 RepID=UPI000486CCAD|nr:hypothetical protein [Crocinitomix catalasitica]|tara:strand:+ start:72 stop:260 length:189 start_codon:yes stop_codon:yes gene_type:complete
MLINGLSGGCVGVILFGNSFYFCLFYLRSLFYPKKTDNFLKKVIRKSNIKADLSWENEEGSG